jgi:metal-responsive CopG/Arc/MetJ family transcriptional regulator
MKMTKVLVSMPESMKVKLDALRMQGYTASGFIRAVLERELKQTTSGQKGR